MFWNLWCERVKFLSPDDLDSSLSETSVASSSSNSTIYLASSRVTVSEHGYPQIWCHYGAGGDAKKVSLSCQSVFTVESSDGR